MRFTVYVLASRIGRTAACLGLCFLVPTKLHAQSSVSEVAALSALTPDRPAIEVFTTRGLRIAGRLVEVTDTLLVLETRSGRREVPCDTVDNAWRPERVKWRRGLIWGSIVGASLAGLARFGQGDCADPTSLCATEGPATLAESTIVTVMGAGMGAYIAWTRRVPRHLLYVSERGFGTPEIEPSAEEFVPSAWLELKDRLAVGNRFEIDQRSNTAIIRGTLVGITPHAIQLLVEKEPYIIPRTDVRKIWTPRLSWRRAIFGATLAMSEFAMITVAVVCGGDSDAEDPCVDRVLGWSAVAGIGIEGWRVFRTNRNALIYNADKPAAGTTTSVYPFFGRDKAGLQVQMRF